MNGFFKLFLQPLHIQAKNKYTVQHIGTCKPDYCLEKEKLSLSHVKPGGQFIC